ncbi:unnamed protein product [Durusdinium trenchii]|uniref:Uncharacterized protein n=1 Tax=Durusdinium trenchii TaxID=1381693 RepID=A0ABP0HTC0_9DINO
MPPRWRASQLALTACAAVMLLNLGAPKTLLDLCDFVAATSYKHYGRDVECFDCFAGKGAVGSAFRLNGCKTVSQDLEMGPAHDLASTPGFLRAILNVLRCVPDGVLVMGPPCGSFVFMNLGTSRRSEHRPYGDESLPHVEMGSLLCSRALLLLLLATVRGVYTVLEQPGTSTMRYYPDLKAVAAAIQKHLGGKSWLTQYMWMGAWGAPTLKPTRVWGTPPWICNLYAKPSKSLRKKLLANSKRLKITFKKTKNGQTSVCGGPGLAATAAYPDGFGRRVFELYQMNKAKWKGAWRKANVAVLKRFVTKAAEKGLFQPIGPVNDREPYTYG